MFRQLRLPTLCFSLIITFLTIIPVDQVQAKVFRNSYVSFELPNRWDCYLENTAWICRYAISKACLGAGANKKECAEQRKKTKEAIIILAAKEVGPKDSFKEYYNHLKAPRPIITKGGKRTASKIIHVKPISIEKHQWIDGMHLGSEIPHYYTRYLTTLKGNIAVLVTFSAHKLFYSKYSSEFFRAIKSLRVLATKAKRIDRRELTKGTGILGDNNIGSYLNDAIDNSNDGFDGDSSSGTGFDFYLIIGAGLLALAGIFVWFKGRR